MKEEGVNDNVIVDKGKWKIYYIKVNKLLLGNRASSWNTSLLTIR